MRIAVFAAAIIAVRVGFAVAAVSSAQDPAKGPKNIVKIRATPKETVEFDLIGDRPFPIVNAGVVLYVGNLKCVTSWNRTGQPNSLTFTTPAATFAQTQNGDAIVVRYEPDSQGHWDFGKLDKSLVTK